VRETYECAIPLAQHIIWEMLLAANLRAILKMARWSSPLKLIPLWE
jgi:hypothetical protein